MFKAIATFFGTVLGILGIIFGGCLGVLILWALFIGIASFPVGLIIWGLYKFLAFLFGWSFVLTYWQSYGVAAALLFVAGLFKGSNNNNG